MFSFRIPVIIYDDRLSSESDGTITDPRQTNTRHDKSKTKILLFVVSSVCLSRVCYSTLLILGEGISSTRKVKLSLAPQG